jgi:hypothetical protein
METWIIEIGYKYADWDEQSVSIEVQELFVGSKEKAEAYSSEVLEQYKVLTEERLDYRNKVNFAEVWISPDGQKYTENAVELSNLSKIQRRKLGWVVVGAGLDPMDTEDKHYSYIRRVVKPQSLEDLRNSHLEVKKIIDKAYKLGT